MQNTPDENRSDVASSAALNFLLSRASTDALVLPAPEGAQLARILSAGLCAPDHGKIRPWRYVVISDAAAKGTKLAFAHKIMEAVARQEPDLPEKKKEKRLHRFASAPAIIALGMALEPEHKTPIWEQKMSIGAGAMNILNALHMEGFGGVWISGPFCEDPFLAENLGLKIPDHTADSASEPSFLAGFLLIGTPESGQKARKRADIAGYMSCWKPESHVSFGADKGR